MMSWSEIFKYPQLACDIGILHHGAAGDDHLAPVCHGGIADLLQAMDMAGERRDDDAALACAMMR